MRIQIEMVGPEKVIFEEISRGDTQESVAITYAFIIRQRVAADWPAINRAITNRWRGKTALRRVKEMAWRRIRQEARHG